LVAGDGRPLRRGDEAEHDGRVADRLGQDLVVGRKLLHLLAQTRERVGFGPEVQRVGGRQTVGLGEHHVEADGRRAVFAEFPDKVGENGARPGPLAHALQRFLVDVDDADGEAGIESARADLLVGVEHERSQPRHGTRVPDAQGKRARDDRPHDEDVKKTGTHTFSPTSPR
jgi:hypothetical protein